MVFQTNFERLGDILGEKTDTFPTCQGSLLAPQLRTCLGNNQCSAWETGQQDSQEAPTDHMLYSPLMLTFKWQLNGNYYCLTMTRNICCCVALRFSITLFSAIFQVTTEILICRPLQYRSSSSSLSTFVQVGWTFLKKEEEGNVNFSYFNCCISLFNSGTWEN